MCDGASTAELVNVLASSSDDEPPIEGPATEAGEQQASACSELFPKKLSPLELFRRWRKAPPPKQANTGEELGGTEKPNAKGKRRRGDAPLHLRDGDDAYDSEDERKAVERICGWSLRAKRAMLGTDKRCKR